MTITITREDCEKKRKVRLACGRLMQLTEWAEGAQYPVRVGDLSFSKGGLYQLGNPDCEFNIIAFADEEPQTDPNGKDRPMTLIITREDCEKKRKVRLANGEVRELTRWSDTNGCYKVWCNDLSFTPEGLFELVMPDHELNIIAFADEEPEAQTDPNGKDQHTPGAKLDAGKDRWDLLFDFAPFDFLSEDFLEVAKIPVRDFLFEMLCTIYLDHDLLRKSIDPRHVVKVATYGAKKYTDGGWLSVPNGIRRYRAAAIQHRLAMETEENDPESGLPHAWHVEWNLWAVFTLEQREKEKKGR